MTFLYFFYLGLVRSMVNPYVLDFENSVDPDQLVSEEPADQDPSLFILGL